MDEPNKERGDVAIILDGRQWTMRPTYAALVEMETNTGRPIMELIASIRLVRFSVRDLAVVIAAGLRGGGEQGVKADQVGPMLVRSGFGTEAIIGPVAQLLENALGGGADPEKKE